MKKLNRETYVLPYAGHIEHVVRCASICYNSTPSDPERMYNRLIERGHLSMLRHETHYYKMRTNDVGAYYQAYFKANPYCGYATPGDSHAYIVVNGQWLYENKKIAEKLSLHEFEVGESEFKKHLETAVLIRRTFLLNTQIAITRELNRSSPNNIAERSTRFIDFNKKLGILYSIPHWWNNKGFFKKAIANTLLKLNEWSYKIARSKHGLNLPPEDARGFLNLMTESSVAYTYSIQEWQHILAIRYYGVTGKPHPDAVEAVKPIRDYIRLFLSNVVANGG